MKLEILINALKKEFRASNNVFYEKIWETRLSNFIKADTKYDKLLIWVSAELELLGETANIFSPTEKSTVKMVNTYKEFMQNTAILVHCRELLCEEKLTDAERENIEYTLCKLFNIHYNELLECYVGN